MPYVGTTPQQDARIEKCANDIMANANFKAQSGESKKAAAIRVCKASILKADALHHQLKK